MARAAVHQALQPGRDIGVNKPMAETGRNPETPAPRTVLNNGGKSREMIFHEYRKGEYVQY